MANWVPNWSSFDTFFRLCSFKYAMRPREIRNRALTPSRHSERFQRVSAFSCNVRSIRVIVRSLVKDYKKRKAQGVCLAFYVSMRARARASIRNTALSSVYCVFMSIIVVPLSRICKFSITEMMTAFHVYLHFPRKNMILIPLWIQSVVNLGEFTIWPLEIPKTPITYTLLPRFAKQYCMHSTKLTVYIGV